MYGCILITSSYVGKCSALPRTLAAPVDALPKVIALPEGAPCGLQGAKQMIGICIRIQHFYATCCMDCKTKINSTVHSTVYSIYVPYVYSYSMCLHNSLKFPDRISFCVFTYHSIHSIENGFDFPETFASPN